MELSTWKSFYSEGLNFSSSLNAFMFLGKQRTNPLAHNLFEVVSVE